MDSAGVEQATKRTLDKRKGSKASARSIDREEASRRIDQHIAEFGDWRGDLLARLRQLIHQVNPAIIEDWKWMGTPVWSHQGMLAHGNIFKNKVKLTFHRGAHLLDPEKLFNASLGAKQSRAIDLFKGDAIDVTALSTLLREAMEYNATHLVPRSKGSRDI